MLHHNFFTAGIGYLKVLFNTEVLPPEDLPVCRPLKSISGFREHRALQLSQI
ncbi:MAG: hypothetical protein ACLUD2_14310 [Clostridium sp.]